VSVDRSLVGVPSIRRDLIKRHLYLVPNSIVVSRGCPHVCDFCYKEAFFGGGRSFYTQPVDAALAEIERLPGRHLYFLDDHLFGNARFASELFVGMRGMGRLWQAASTVKSVLQPGLLEQAVEAGLRSLFVGFETTNTASLRAQRKFQNINYDYDSAIRRLHDLGVMVNASFVFGMDEDDASVFDRTVEWAIERGIETATFHILTPYPSTALYQRMSTDGRLLHHDWDRYDTRHVVYQPRSMAPDVLEEGYWRAYDHFYRWGSILRSAKVKPTVVEQFRHVGYSAGWKKFEPLWDQVIRAKRVRHTLPILETILSGFGTIRAKEQDHEPGPQGGDDTPTSAELRGADRDLTVLHVRTIARSVPKAMTGPREWTCLDTVHCRSRDASEARGEQRDERDHIAWEFARRRQRPGSGRSIRVTRSRPCRALRPW